MLLISSPRQLAPPRRNKESEEKPQPEALIERLTLEETTVASEQPINYGLKLVHLCFSSMKECQLHMLFVNLKIVKILLLRDIKLFSSL